MFFDHEHEKSIIEGYPLELKNSSPNLILQFVTTEFHKMNEIENINKIKYTKVFSNKERQNTLVILVECWLIKKFYCNFDQQHDKPDLSLLLNDHEYFNIQFPQHAISGSTFRICFWKDFSNAKSIDNWCNETCKYFFYKDSSNDSKKNSKKLFIIFMAKTFDCHKNKLLELALNSFLNNLKKRYIIIFMTISISK